MTNQEELKQKIWEVKEELGLANLGHLLQHFVYVPEVPMVGMEEEYVIEEYFGVKVARLVSSPD